MKLGLFLLAGAIINVAEAWAIDVTAQPTRAQIVRLAPVQAWMRAYGEPLHRRLPAWNVSGWPFDSLLRQDQGVGLMSPVSHSWRTGLRVSTAWIGPLSRDHVFLPILPTLTGFALNTIFYAAVLWVLFALPFKVRRWRRIKRGQCSSCGYSLRDITSEKCPECGESA